MANKNILLIEPGYRNKYPPLGLMKIAQYHGPNGKRDNVRFIKGEDSSVIGQAWDRIYITTLFSFEWARTARSIDFALEVARGQAERIFVGGIAASLMHEQFINEPRWCGIRFIKGLLGSAPATSLQLDPFDEELYSDDLSGDPIEDLVPDYSILNQIEYAYPVSDAYFSYTSRGCVRKCKFCGVPALEGMQRDTETLTAIVEGVSRLYGEKKDLVLMDNNVVASAKFKDIIAEIIDLGFERGATLKRGRIPVQRRVDFNQGIDARILCKDPMYLREFSKIAIKPLRIAFDHLGVKKPYSQAIRYAADAGLTDLSNYMLYNFHDTPEDLFERMRLNVELNEELDIRIFSFPMRYQPVTRPDRGHVGPKWNSYFLRSMQIILQATHGIVSGAPNYFRTAFGDTYDEFDDILMRPHHYIFNRYWYEHYDGRGELEDYEAGMKRLAGSEKEELLEFLCNRNRKEYERDLHLLSSSRLRQVGRHYVPIPKREEARIWEAQKARRREDLDTYLVAEDERVEDAGLTDDGFQPTRRGGDKHNTRAVA
ncbi:MAG: radical SAM protein [bacterium]